MKSKKKKKRREKKNHFAVEAWRTSQMEKLQGK